jgi:DNA modification methylase
MEFPMKNKIFNMDCGAGLNQLPDQCIQCVVTSPPYYGLRDYGMEDQIGLEDTPEEYIEKMVRVFQEVRRVLKDDGTLWLNIGDSYARNGGTKGGGNRKMMYMEAQRRMTTAPANLKEKDLIGIPWMLAFALRADGWYLRQDIIWSKPNPMPESVTDRCTKSHEYIFLLSKSQKYFYNHEAIKTPVVDSSIDRLKQSNIDNQNGSDRVPGKVNGNMKAVSSGNKHRKVGSERGCPEDSGSNVCASVPWEGVMANKRSVWTVTTKPFKEAHFATFPEDLIVDCIKAGSKEEDLILNPFMGAGTTAIVARKLNRNYVGFELNPTYVEICERRLYNELGMFR